VLLSAKATADAVASATPSQGRRSRGLIGPWLIGLVKDSTGSYSLALATISGFLLIAAAIAATMRVTAQPRQEEAAITPKAT
jgi:MFS transporter, ACS family, tartrate transporter